MQGEGGENERSRGKKEREMEKKFAYIQKIAYLCTSASNDAKFSQSSCYALARQHNCDTHKSGLGTTNQNISWRQSCVAP